MVVVVWWSIVVARVEGFLTNIIAIPGCPVLISNKNSNVPQDNKVIKIMNFS